MPKFLPDHNYRFATKTNEYKIAIERYNNIAWYTRIEFLASLIIIILQFATTVQLFQHYNGTCVFYILVTIVISYLLTDFINGFTHMIIDNNTHYKSIVGPFIAAFHLHHSRLIYKENHPLKIYFYESGHKLWLVFYLIAVFITQCCMHLNFCLTLCLVMIGIFSSFAELSHYWCHNNAQNNNFIRLLQKHRILLSMKHHRIHHARDNVHYAFLNGVTDPLLNIIANKLYNGYKNNSDKHVFAYDRNRQS